jgi:hypothetical protein
MDSAVDSVDSVLCWDTGSSDAHQEEYLAHHHHHQHVQGDALVDLQHLESQHQQGEVVHLDESSGLHHQHEPADLNNQTDEVSAARAATLAFYSSN